MTGSASGAPRWSWVCAGVPSAYAVQGGTPTGAVAAATVKIDVGGTRACSGALLSASWVITAKSCFSETRADPGRPGCAGGGHHRHGRTRGPDRHRWPGREGPAWSPHASRDVVLARLAAPVTGVAPVRVGGPRPRSAASSSR